MKTEMIMLFVNSNKNKILTCSTIFFFYCLASYLNNPVLGLNAGLAGDIALGFIISILSTIMIYGVRNYNQNSLLSAILTGGLITIIGMGVYGLLNNTLELTLSTKRDEIDDKIDIVALDISLSKPQYTRTKILDVEVIAYKKTQTSDDFKIDKNYRFISFLTKELQDLTTEFKVDGEDKLIVTEKSTKLVLVPGDKVSYELPIVVSKKEVVRFDVAILGQQVILGIPIRWSRPQWSSSVISFHAEDTKD